MSSSQEQNGAAALFALLSKRAGLRFPQARHASVGDSFAGAMKRAGARDLTDYAARIDDGRASFDDLVERVTVGETYFFREPAQLVYLATRVLPALIATDPSRPIRMWSAACASGEEAYTLAMALESFGAAGTVLGTDISRAALAEAREATYGKWSLRGPAAAAARPFLRAEGKAWRVVPRIRQRVHFRQLNLATDPFPGRASGEPPFDVVFCRNVLIYLEPAVVARVAAGLFDALADGGWLFTAASDPPLREHAPFEHVVTDAGVFYRRPDPREQVIAEAERASRQPEGLIRSAIASAPKSAGAPRSGGRSSGAPSSASRARPPPASRRKSARASTRRPLDGALEMSAEAHYLDAVSLIDQRRDDEASGVLRRALYLDRSLVAAQFALGLLLERKGDTRGARRAFQNVQRLCEKAGPGDPIPFAGGTCASQLASLAKEREAALAPRNR